MQVDDITARQWIMATGWRDESESCDPFFGRRDNPSIAGVPIKVLAVSLPFAACEMNGEKITIDVRRFRFVRPTTAYRKIYAPAKNAPTKNTSRDLAAAMQQAVKLVKDGFCQRCGSRLRSRRLADSTWMLRCPECE